LEAFNVTSQQEANMDTTERGSTGNGNAALRDDNQWGVLAAYIVLLGLLAILLVMLIFAVINWLQANPDVMWIGGCVVLGLFFSALDGEGSATTDRGESDRPRGAPVDIGVYRTVQGGYGPALVRQVGYNTWSDGYRTYEGSSFGSLKKR
jgi:hypothetical protein